jgi:serine/threonine protein kinase, bacterial
VDAAGSQYYADAARGIVMKVTTAQTQIPLASDLKHPLIAVDFRGNVFVADTGNNRVLKIAAGAKHPVSLLANAVAIGGIAVDANNNVFFSSDNSNLVEVPNNGTPTIVARLRGASLLAFGPAANGMNHLYVVAQKSNSYNAYLYSYSSSEKAASGALSGPLFGFLPAIVSGSITSFASIRMATRSGSMTMTERCR